MRHHVGIFWTREPLGLRTLAFAATIACAGAIGCGDDEAEGDDNGTGNPAPTATAYILHGSPDAPDDLTLRAGTTTLATGFSFGELTGRLTVPTSGSVQVFASGSTTPAATLSFNVSANQTYLFVVRGYLAPPAGNTNGLNILPVPVAFQAPASGKSRLRAVHASPDAPAVDISVVGGATLTDLFANVSYGQESPAAGLEVDAGAVDLAITPAGATTIAAGFDVTVPPDARIVAVAIGALNPRATTDEPFRLALVVTGATWSVNVLAPTPAAQ